MSNTRIVNVEGDWGATEDQIRASVAEMRAHNGTHPHQVAAEKTAKDLRATLERELDGIDLPTIRKVLVKGSGMLNVALLTVDPECEPALGYTQNVLLLALYGQPGD